MLVAWCVPGVGGLVGGGPGGWSLGTPVFCWVFVGSKNCWFFFLPNERRFSKPKQTSRSHIFGRSPRLLLLNPPLSQQNSKPDIRHISQVGRKAFARTFSFSNVIFGALWEEGEEEASKKAMTFGEFILGLSISKDWNSFKLNNLYPFLFDTLSFIKLV